ncbi:hypothetical protein [Streptomyces neyagawaensis]|uniref:DUF2964 family protein n=1 Tax=Streptomyces neyagawaensis TaxID=42238 RepID=A0ABV3AS60_9ACTN
MSIDLRMSLRRHYTTFLAVLVTGIVLIMAVNGTAPTLDVYLNCLMSVAGMIAAYVLAPLDSSRSGDRDGQADATGDEAR